MRDVYIDGSLRGVSSICTLVPPYASSNLAADSRGSFLLVGAELDD